MAKKATAKRGTSSKPKPAKKSGRKAKTIAIARTSSKQSKGNQDTDGMGEAFIKLLQSPLAADLVAVAATAALAALAEQGFTHRGADSAGKRAGKAVKEAGKAAAAAVGRRLSVEIDEIRKASKTSAKA